MTIIINKIQSIMITSLIESKAFKGMRKNLTGYNKFQFAVGEIYEIALENEIEPCGSGFHACINLVDCLYYYSNDAGNRFFEITIFGDYKVRGSTICARKIRIDKEINLAEVLNGEYTDYRGTKQFYVNGKLHRDGDLPAEIHPDGTKGYYKNDERHRDGDLPAIIKSGGTTEYYKNGKLHRAGDLPAVINSVGTQEFCRHIAVAIINSGGNQYCFKN